MSGGGQDGFALIIQVLLIVAFLALTVFTIGVLTTNQNLFPNLNTSLRHKALRMGL